MTKEELAVLLDGREYTEEMAADEEKQAEVSALVAIFGASDDLCELRGAIYDEVPCYGGGSLWILDGGLLPDMDEEDGRIFRDCTYNYGVLLEKVPEELVADYRAVQEGSDAE